MKQIQHLLDVQVVTDRQPLQPGLFQNLRRQRIRHVQRKIARDRQTGLFEIRNGPQIPDQHAIRLRTLDQLEKARLAGFLNARRRQPKLRLRARIPHFGHQIAISPDVLKIEVQPRNARFERRRDLLTRAAKSEQFLILDS